MHIGALVKNGVVRGLDESKKVAHAVVHTAQTLAQSSFRVFPSEAHAHGSDALIGLGGRPWLLLVTR